MIQLKAPWNERNGKFSPLKAVVFAGLFVPALWIAYLAATGALEPKVVTEMIHRTGLWAIRFLTLSLLVTPLMRGARYPKLVAIRRMVGVAAFAYAAAHLSLYIVDQHYDLLHVASEIVLRFYLTIGFVTWLGLAALAATSTDGMIRRLGPRWRQLHSIVYALGVLALLHFMIQAKADVSEPVMMTGFFAILMLFRALVKRGLPAWGAAPPGERMARSLPIWTTTICSAYLGSGANHRSSASRSSTVNAPGVGRRFCPGVRVYYSPALSPLRPPLLIAPTSKYCPSSRDGSRWFGAAVTLGAICRAATSCISVRELFMEYRSTSGVWRRTAHRRPCLKISPIRKTPRLAGSLSPGREFFYTRVRRDKAESPPLPG